jgi:glycosyltransferase involved in cell wall biosynthesis
MRLSRLLGRPYSVTAHAHDIYRKTRNLPEKLRRAAFSTSGCDYTVRDLQRIAGPGHADRVHKIVMGVAGEQFQRSEPYPGGRVVVAVGRLVRKKGFRYLLQAVGILRGSFPLDRVVFLGDGPLTRKLRILARRGGVSDQVEWLGAQPHSAVRELLERADLLVMPCVIAGSGNRDSMPVVVKEALAMEVPVVASDEVGLPEIVREPWGRLAPPRDAEALAEQIRQVLSRSREERIEMGRAGRAFVLEHCDLYRETAKLAELITAASGAVPTGAGIARTASGRS